jgi:hypothetical protein
MTRLVGPSALDALARGGDAVDLLELPDLLEDARGG